MDVCEHALVLNKMIHMLNIDEVNIVISFLVFLAASTLTHFCFRYSQLWLFVLMSRTTDKPQSLVHILVVCTLLAQVSDHSWKWNEYCHDAADRCRKCYQTVIGCSYNFMPEANVLYIDQSTISSQINHSLHIDNHTWVTCAINKGGKAQILIVFYYTYSYLYQRSSPCLHSCW